MTNSECFKGIWKDSFIVVYGSYSYRKDKDHKGIRYLRCAKLRGGCNARAILF